MTKVLVGALFATIKERHLRLIKPDAFANRDSLIHVHQRKVGEELAQRLEPLHVILLSLNANVEIALLVKKT